RGGAALSVAVQAHRQAADAPPQRLALDFVRGTGHVPGVQRKHADPLGLGCRCGRNARPRRGACGMRWWLELLTIRSYMDGPVKIAAARGDAGRGAGGDAPRLLSDGTPARRQAPVPGPARTSCGRRPVAWFAVARDGKLLTITNCCGLLDASAACRAATGKREDPWARRCASRRAGRHG